MKRIRGAMVMLACLGMVCPQMKVYAASPKSAQEKSKTTSSSSVVQAVDVSLAKGGVFSGRVVDEQGKAVEGANVTIRQAGRVVATTTTTANGEFTVANLRGGTYDVMAGQSEGVYRMWAVDTAPPSAAAHPMIVSRARIVRGDCCGVPTGNIVGWTALGIGIAALTVGIIALDKADASN
ncbi:MAG: carboxypeptidase-like regulatory domain-containing protein [Planctomycetales bacterium]